MPYVDLHSEDDYASIYYHTNAPRNNVSGFDPEKSTVIILHPYFLDSTWLDNQFGDPRLNDSFNLVAFDMRFSGRSTCRMSGRQDAWVNAADLAFCHQALHLPPCHILALETLAIYCTLRFAVLFPEMCLSLTLCNVPAPTELQWMYTGFEELVHNWCNAEDLESFEHVAKEGLDYVVGPDCDADLQDELIAFWEINMPPSQAVRITAIRNTIANRTPLKPEVYATIRQPVLLIHGERNEACSKTHAEKLASQLSNAEGGAVIYTVKGASGTLNIIPGHASIANQVFGKFISRLPHKRSELIPPEISKRDRMKKALSTLAGIIGDGSIENRSPLSSLSFCCLPPEVVKDQTDSVNQRRKRLAHAHTLLSPEGRPLRRYSERKTDHWFHSEKNGLSIAGSTFLPPERASDSADKLSPQDLGAEGRLRRAPGSRLVEKRIIKDSMTKVASTQKPPLQPLPI
ncbi:alpha/beta-hydrolase [Tricholoma matsutake]|nr:alpha/beta-hydrolase [Tricholoma matsutake 945]